MYSPVNPSPSYPTVTTSVAGRMNEEDRIDLMRFLFMGPTRSVGDRGQEDIGADDDWFEGESEVSVPELVPDIDDSFHGLVTEEQGKEAAAVEDPVQEEDFIDQEQDAELDTESGESDQEGEEQWIASTAQGAPSLSIESLTLYRLLGEGGFGKVYAASLKSSKKVHAVKIIPKMKENGDQTLREQDLLRRLIGCPFFSQLEASWQSSLNYYLVSPIYPGNLRDEVDKTCGLTTDVAHFYIKQILAGVDYLHSNYILHRDLKLDNILLTPDGHAVICDFGLATMVLFDGRARHPFEKDPHQHLPDFYIENQSYRFGTPQSTAPEVLLGNTYGFPSDMWSFGVMIYEIITGQQPWRGEFETTAELYKAILGTDPDFVPREWLDCTGLCSIARRLLHKDPSQRPSTGELLFSRVFLGFGGWDSVQDFSKSGPIKPGNFSRGEVLRESWVGRESERDQQVTDADSSFTFTGPEILREIEVQRTSLPTFQPVKVLRKSKGQVIARVRPLLTRINTSAVLPSVPQADSVPRISSATSHGSIDIPEVGDPPELSFDFQEASPKMCQDRFQNPFPSLVDFYLDETIHPHPSPVLYEAVPLAARQSLSEAFSRLPSSEATSVYSSDHYFSSMESLGDIAASTSTTPLAGVRDSGRIHSKNKKALYGREGKLLGWVRRLWRRGFGSLMS